METWRECLSGAIAAGAVAMTIYGAMHGLVAAGGYLHRYAERAVAEREAREVAIVRRAIAAHEADKAARR